MEFEDILEQVGGYGRYQKYLTVFFLIPATCILPWLNMNGLFMVSVPDHWCYVPDVAHSNLSLSQQRTLVSSGADPSCSMHDVNYTDYMYGNAIFLNNTPKVPCKTGWQYDKTDYTATASTKWNLVCDHGYFPSLILTLQNVGSVILTPMYGYFADRYGRKTVYLFLAAMSAVTDLLSVIVDDFTTFIVMRAIHGSGMPSILTLTFMLIVEIVKPEVRAHMNGIVNCSWAIGLSSLPLVVYLSRNWVNLGIISAVVCFGILIYSKIIPESPCWLISSGKYEEATDIIQKIGRVNNRPQERTHLFNQLQDLGQRIQKKKHTSKRSSYLFLLYPRIRKRFLILIVCWIAFYISYYGLIFNLRNLAGNQFLNFFAMSIVEIPGDLLFWTLMDRAGRRWTASLGFTALGLVCLGPLIGFRHSDIVFSIIGKFISSGLYMLSEQQATELFPTESRSLGINLGKTIAYIAALLSPFLADLGAYGKNLPFVVMSCISLVAGALASFLPETLNENLPQTISDAEEFGTDQEFFSWRRQRSPPKEKSENLTTDEIDFERF